MQVPRALVATLNRETRVHVDAGSGCKQGDEIRKVEDGKFFREVGKRCDQDKGMIVQSAGREHFVRGSCTNMLLKGCTTQVKVRITILLKSTSNATLIVILPRRYIEHILIATHSGEAGVAEVFRVLQNRLRDSTWTVVFKSLITVHMMIREGSPDTTLSYVSKHRSMLSISNFQDGMCF